MRRWAPTSLCLLIPVLAACGGSTSPTPRATTAKPVAALASDYAIADDQYHRIQVGLALPDGVSFPAHLPNTSEHYPANAGTVTAQNYWLCAWLGAYLTKKQSRQALGHLPEYVRMDAYSKALDARGRSTVDTVIRDARKGSTKAVATFTRNSCGGPFYGHAHPA